jgi:hypothetical protein
VLLKLQAALGVDLQFFSENEEERLMAQLHDVVANRMTPSPRSWTEAPRSAVLRRPVASAPTPGA